MAKPNLGINGRAFTLKTDQQGDDKKEGEKNWQQGSASQKI